MEPLNFAITGLTLDTVIGNRYDEDYEGGDRRPQTLADAIIEHAVEELWKRPEASDIVRRVAQIRDEVIRERVNAEVEAALTGPFTKTNAYGEPTGQTTTLREEIARIAAQAVNTGGNSYSREQTAAEKVIRSEVNVALDRELKEVVKQEKDKVVAAVRAKAADLIAQAVREGIGR